MRMNLRQVINENAKKAEITTAYQGKVITRHCVKTAAGLRGHHPDTEGVRLMKRAVAEVKSLKNSIEICERDLKNPKLSDERREQLENRLLEKC